MMCFKPNEKAPEYVKGKLIVSLNKFIQYCKENPDLLKDYMGEKQLELDIMNGSKGLYLQVNTYRSEPKVEQEKLPF
jgi:outer membrane phospholipase A